MCPTHILVHHTPPLRGEFSVLGQGIQLFSGGGYFPTLQGGYINPCAHGKNLFPVAPTNIQDKRQDRTGQDSSSLQYSSELQYNTIQYSTVQRNEHALKN